MKKTDISSKINTILWATDFSKESRFCLPYIRFFSTILKTKNHALYVLPKFSDWVVETAFASDDELLETIKKTKEKSKTKIVNYSKKSNISFEPQVIEGRITNEEIIKYAKEKGVDLIFAGRRGISEIEEILIGSTTSRLIRNSDIPVLVIPGARRKVKIEKVLCPIDFSEFSMMELEYAISLSGQLKAKLYVVHISEFFSYRVPMLKRDVLIDKINKNIVKIAEKYKYKVENIIHDIGEPAQKIIEIAKKNKIDIITMSTHQRKGIEKFFLGSISEKVLLYSNLPVLILPPPQP
ncbi:MAG: universal stress protein [Candidatus Aminicenantes bacterium]|nr:MAG: universal stress protein [Candidatus Aminicenantes bacterium]